MVGLIIIGAMGLFVLVGLLYATRCEDNFDTAAQYPAHPAWRWLRSLWRWQTGVPTAQQSPWDRVYFSEIDADRELQRRWKRRRPKPRHPFGED